MDPDVLALRAILNSISTQPEGPNATSDATPEEDGHYAWPEDSCPTNEETQKIRILCHDNAWVQSSAVGRKSSPSHSSLSRSRRQCFELQICVHRASEVLRTCKKQSKLATYPHIQSSGSTEDSL